MSVDSALRRPSGSVSGLTDITPRVAATNPAHRCALNAEPGGCGKCASDEQGNEEEGPETEEMNLEGDEELNDREVEDVDPVGDVMDLREARRGEDRAEIEDEVCHCRRLGSTR